MCGDEKLKKQEFEVGYKYFSNIIGLAQDGTGHIRPDGSFFLNTMPKHY